jgi:hypothetical protein
MGQPRAVHDAGVAPDDLTVSSRGGNIGPHSRGLQLLDGVIVHFGAGLTTRLGSSAARLEPAMLVGTSALAAALCTTAVVVFTCRDIHAGG